MQAESIMANPRLRGRWLLIVNVVLLALTAQLYRGDKFFGLHRPILDAVDPCTGVSCAVNPDPRCSAAANGTCSNGQCSFTPENEGGSCGTGLVCKFGSCVQETDACVPLTCNTPSDAQCQASTGTCSNGVCHYAPVADGTLCGPLFTKNNPGNSSSQGEPSKWLGSSCLAGVCVTKTSSEVTSFAYDSSISTGIVSAALAIEAIITGSGSPDLAGFAITTGLVAIGWTGYSQDVGAFPVDSALVRSQNAFVFIGAGFAILFALGILREKKGTTTVLLRVLAFANIIVATVQFGLVSRLLDQHFQYNEEGTEDSDANILFNWAYPATIYFASVAVAVAVSILVSGSVSSGFAGFQLITAVIALAWASNLNAEEPRGTNPPDDFSDTSLAWQSFTFIAGAYSVIAGLILILKGKAADSPFTQKILEKLKLPGRLLALAFLVLFCTVIGQVSELFNSHFLDERDRGANMLIVDAQNDNFGNAVSPFAWPISIWTAAVVCSFSIEVLKNGVAQTGITALALTEAANLVGWAAQHTYFGSQHIEADGTVSGSLEGTTRGWQSVCLGSAIVTFFFCLHLLLAQENDLEAKEFVTHAADHSHGSHGGDRPKQDV